MRRIAAIFVLLAACEPFQPEMDNQQEDAKQAFEHWRDLILAGRMTESIQSITQSFKSQWLYDRMVEGDSAALDWKAKLRGNARTDLELWFGEAARDKARGRVATLPRTVLQDPTLDPLLITYLKDAALDLKYEFSKMEITDVRIDRGGATLWIHNGRGEPEWYEMVIEGGGWKLNHHLSTPAR